MGELARSSPIGNLGGRVELITARLAWHASFAVVDNATGKRRSLPAWPLS